MSTSALAADERVIDVEVTEDELTVRLMDGRAISVPLVWYPRLLNATPEQRKNWHTSGGGYGIHWEDIDEDLSTRGLLLGIPASQQTSSAMRAFQVREYPSSEHSETNPDLSIIQDTDYPKGVLDYLVEVGNAGKEIVSILSGIGTLVVENTGKIEQRVTSIGNVTSSPAGTTLNDVHKVALLLAFDMTEFAKNIDESTQRFNRNTDILEKGLLAYISLLKSEDRENIEQLGGVKDSLHSVLNTAREIKESIAAVRDTVQAVRDRGISYAITKAADRQQKALNGLMEGINELETFALRIELGINEKLSQA